MASLKPKSVEASPSDSAEFSLTLGGPLYQLWRRIHLSGDALGLVRRRIVVVALLAWMPLLILSLIEGKAWWGSVKLPFLQDIETHVRLLLALPVLILSELLVDRRTRPIVGQFEALGLIPAAAKAQFEAAIAAAVRLRNSFTAELLLVVLVYVVGVGFVWRTQIALRVESWYGVAAEGRLQPTVAGWWLGCVSLPIFQFLLVRWYFRFFILARFLWQTSRIELSLMATHPDRCGGLGFLASLIKAFAPVLLAQGLLLAGLMANRIFFAGEQFSEFKLEIIGQVALIILIYLGPLLLFLPQLAAVKRKGLLEYGRLAQRYAREFDSKWVRGVAPSDAALLGSADIQSLADMGNSYAVVKEMRLVPFTMNNVLELAVVVLLPVGPLLLTMIPLEEVLLRLLKLVF